MQLRPRYAIVLCALLLQCTNAWSPLQIRALRIRQDSGAIDTETSVVMGAADTVVETVVVSEKGKKTPVVGVTVTSIAPTPVKSRVVTLSSQSNQQRPESTGSSGSSTAASPSITAPPTCDAGYKMCHSSLGGGCCPSNFECGQNSCIVPTSVTETRTCKPSSFLCPASLGYGCCADGSQCGQNNCIVPTASLSGISATAALTSADAQTTEVPKGPDIPIGQKISATVVATASATSTTATTDTLPGLSPIAIGGIVAGCVSGVLILALAGWLVQRRIKNGRGNNEPFWRRGHNHDDMIGAATVNAYDPNAPPVRDHSGRRNRYQPVYSQGSPLPSPSMAQTSPSHHDLDFGFPGANRDPVYAGRQGFYDPHLDNDPTKYRPVSLDSPPPTEPYKDTWKQDHPALQSPPPVEIGDTGNRAVISPDLYEVEGDNTTAGTSPPKDGRWSTSISKAFRRSSGPIGGGGGAAPASGMRDF